ncbi:hypothetical protein BCT00_06655 [Vibrio breoganii]|nr:hypothetical protein BCT28_03945 [Vibrio breoganii]PMO82907.1 hypothetical protein BCT00_06655 [Vibrio breoganii]
MHKDVILSDKLKIKRATIISDIQDGLTVPEYSRKILKLPNRQKILSARLNRDYRLLFYRHMRGWKYVQTIQRKDLERWLKQL